MNKHTSNPFLADWDDGDDDNRLASLQRANARSIFSDEQQHEADEEKENAESQSTQSAVRRSSCSQLAADQNQSTTTNGRPNLSLYRRNMSSFDAASSLEQHLVGSGAAAGDDWQQQKELIAKMTADFQSAIETSDKQFADLDSFNPFDPFETIVDDDSLTTPTSNSARPEAADRKQQQQQQQGRHDSIDDDEEELVSTPVRNIKKSSPSPQQQQQLDESCTMQVAGAQPGELPEVKQDGDSIAKATLFASLLASAEPDTSSPPSAEQPDDDDDDHKQPTTNEVSAHVIKGSPTAGDERPVGFFDPFETVIDKDALTSLMSHDNQNQNQQAASNNTLQTTARSARAVAESASIETVIENTKAAAAAASASHESSDAEADARQQPKHKLTSGITPPQPTPSRRPVKARATPKTRVQRRGEPEEDSASSSSGDDNDNDRIQIVIRARTREPASGGEAGSGAAPLVPLLPPPPSKSSMKQARERGQVEDMPSPIMGYKNRRRGEEEAESEDVSESAKSAGAALQQSEQEHEQDEDMEQENDDDNDDDDDAKFVIPMTLSDNEEDSEYAKPQTPLYDEDTSYVLEEFPAKHEAPGWELMLRYPPKKKLTANRFWKKIFVKLAQVPLAPVDKTTQQQQQKSEPQLCWALQIFDHAEDKKPMQEIPIQATYTVSEISSQLFDQFGKIFTIKLQYIFYKERVGVRQGQLARFIHTGHIGTSTTSGGHGVDPISIGAIKRMGAPIEHSPQISQIIKLGCSSYEQMKSFKEALEDCLFRMPIVRTGALASYKTEEVQMAVRDESYVEINQIGTITKQLARVRLFFLSFLNGTPIVEVGINDQHRQGREVVGRMDILPVVTEEWIRLEACELHSTVEVEEFEKLDSRLIKLSPPDATFFELMRFRVRPPRNRELPLQISANMSVTRTRVSINCDIMVPGCVSRKHGQIPCENIAIRFHIPECWIYFFREEKHFRMGSKKSVNRRPGKVKGIERFLGGAAVGVGGVANVLSGAAAAADDGLESSLIEVTSGQAKYEHHHGGVVWRAARWPKESQAAYVQNTMKIRLPLTAYDKMPESFYEYVHVEYTMPATTVSHTTLRSISVNPCDEEPAEKYVKYAAKYEYKVKMRLSVNLGNRRASEDATSAPEASPIVMMKTPTTNTLTPPPPPPPTTTTTTTKHYDADDDDLEREKEPDEDEDDDDDDDDDDEAHYDNGR